MNQNKQAKKKRIAIKDQKYKKMRAAELKKTQQAAMWKNAGFGLSGPPQRANLRESAEDMAQKQRKNTDMIQGIVRARQAEHLSQQELQAAQAESATGAEKKQINPSKSYTYTKDWKSAVDTTSGKTFYYNKTTGDKTWDKPENWPDQHAAAETTNQEGTNGWSENTDTETGKTYYYNKNTRESTWVKPNILIESRIQERARDLRARNLRA